MIIMKLLKINVIVRALDSYPLNKQMHQHLKTKAITALSLSLSHSPPSIIFISDSISIKRDTACFCFCLSDSTSMHWCEEYDVGAATKRRLILNNIAGNTLTVFQFSFAVNNLRMWFDFHSAPSLWLEGGGLRGSRRGGGWRGRNVDADIRCHVSVLLTWRRPSSDRAADNVSDSEAWWRDAAERCVMEKYRQPITNKTGSYLQANFGFIQHYYCSTKCHLISELQPISAWFINPTD